MNLEVSDFDRVFKQIEQKMVKCIQIFILICLSFFGNAQVIMTDGGFSSTCMATFYDEGGENGNYTDAGTLVHTICPDNANSCIWMDFESFHTQNEGNFFPITDELKIYDGADINAPFLTSFVGDLSEMTFPVSASTGCLTFEFIASPETNFSGWEATVMCMACPESIESNDQDCISAIPVCNDLYYQPTSPIGTGNVPNEIHPTNSCMSVGEMNSMWYYIVVEESGQFNFVITPVNGNDNYNWAVFDLTNNDCSEIYDNSNMLVSCNYSQFAGATGANSNAPYNGMGNNALYPGQAFNASIDVEAGDIYVLNVSNFEYDNISGGYHLDFRSSTAVLFNETAPVLEGLSENESLSCGTTELSIHFSQLITCSSVQTSDFIVTNANGLSQTIASVEGVSCMESDYSQDFIINFTNPLANGTYTLSLVNSLDNACGISSTTGSINIEILPITTEAGEDQIFCEAVPINTILGENSAANATYIWTANPPSAVAFLSATNTAQVSFQQNEPQIGTYIYTLTIQEGNCTNSDIVTVTVDNCCQAFYADMTDFTKPSCFQAPTGTATVAAFNANGGVSYLWNTNSQHDTPIADGLLGDTPYMVTVTDDLGCSDVVTVVLEQPIVLSITTIGERLLCHGDTDGNIDLTVEGGTPPYTYLWDNNLGTIEDPENLGAGLYRVTITDVNTCTHSDVAEITQPATPITVIATGSEIACGASNGTINLTVSGGLSPYEFEWSNGLSSTPNQTGLIAGVYGVTITDLNQCRIETSATVSLEGDFIATATGNTITCGGDNNGSIMVNVNGGASPYSFSWSDGLPATQNQTNLDAGTYTVTVSDANNCSISLEATIDLLNTLSVEMTTSKLLCYGDANATATAIINNGEEPYTFLWNNGEITGSINNLSTGTYTVTVTDAGGCQNTASQTIETPLELVVIINKQDIICFGESDGIIDVAVEGGVAPYSYQWSNGEITNSIANLATGTYTITITDDKGCENITTTVVENVAELQVVFTTTNVSCAGSNTGSISTAITGGIAPYTYEWSNEGQNSSIENLLAGTYTLTLTDANDCTLILNSTITESASLEASLIPTPISCYNTTTGVIEVVTEGGIAPYSYQWSTGNTTNSPIYSGLEVGTYTVTIIDNANCSIIKSTTLTEPSFGLAVEIISANSLLCAEDENGAIDIEVTGGTVPYAYIWNTGKGDEDLNGILGGEYSVTVTDENGCIMTETITINAPEMIALNEVITLPTCNQNNGLIDLNPTGGIAPYSFLWSNGFIGEDLENIAPAHYQVKLTDANGCIAIRDFNLEDLAGIVVNATIDVPINTECEGKIYDDVKLTIDGGEEPYSFLWSNGSIEKDQYGLSVGIHAITVTDSNGCFTIQEVEIAPAIPILEAEIASGIINCTNSLTDLSLEVRGGTAPYSFDWNNELADIQNPTNVSAGNYIVTITETNGCEIVQEITLENQASISIKLMEDININYGENAELMILNPNEEADYTWLGSDGSIQTGNNIIVMPKITTSYIVQMELGDCTAQDEIEVVVNNDVQIALPNVFSPNGDGHNDDFYIITSCPIEVVEFKIIDRWGNVVHNDPNTPWNGESQTKRQSIEVFVYLVSIRKSDGTILSLKGDITLLR